MAERTVEDRLREEYFDLLPEIRRVAWQLETEIRFHTLPILQSLGPAEQLIVKTRIKECESAIKKLRRPLEGGTFDRDKADSYSLLNLADLAGVRVLVFPRSKVNEVDSALRDCLEDWTPDPVQSEGIHLAHKYTGICPRVSQRIRAEYQVVPMLIGLFWEVEHSALYKHPSFKKGSAESAPMQSARTKVESALLAFEKEYEAFVPDHAEPSS
jgi:ppGpp synthetase/RelA/SpoT-type nucleotidyltranferase